MIKTYNKLMLAPYTGTKKIKASVKSGFASVQQRGTMWGLKVLADATIIQGNNELYIKKNSVAFFAEDVLASSPWAKKTYQCEGTEGEFIVVDFSLVSFIDLKD